MTDLKRIKRITLGTMCFALFMVMLDSTVVNLALPTIQRELGASMSELQWIVDAFVLALASLLLTGGTLGDMFGRRRAFIIGVALFTVGSRRLRPRAVDGRADRRAPVPGRRRGDDDAEHAVDPHQHVPGRARAGAGHRHLGRRLGPRARHRPADRRLAGRHLRLAEHLLDQRADRR